MNVPVKLGVYALGLVAAFGVAAGVGRAVGPIGSAADEVHAADEADAHTDHSAGGKPVAGPTDEMPGGLMVSTRGYTLALAGDTLPAGPATPLSFRIIGADGAPVTDFEETHDKDLHLIAVRRDMSGFQHVHPTHDEAGTWSVPLALTPGEWRVFADFAVAGDDEGLTLGADVTVAGSYQPVPLPAPAATFDVDGYTVTLDGTLSPGKESKLTLSISRDGEPVTDLEPYLAAYGHLVALRDGDLAYLHVHPDGEPGDGVTEPGPDVAFYATAPSAGDYRLFLDFKHDGVVRTAEFTVRAGTVATGHQDGATGHQDGATGHDGDASHHGEGR